MSTERCSGGGEIIERVWGAASRATAAMKNHRPQLASAGVGSTVALSYSVAPELNDGRVVRERWDEAQSLCMVGGSDDRLDDVALGAPLGIRIPGRTDARTPG